jgi:hypothetical protein
MMEHAAGVFEKVSASNPRYSASQIAAMQKSADASDNAYKLQDKLKQNKELYKIDWIVVYLIGRAYLHADRVSVDLDRARTLLVRANSGGVKASAEQVAWAYYLKDQSEKTAGKLDGEGMGMFAVNGIKRISSIRQNNRATFRVIQFGVRGADREEVAGRTSQKGKCSDSLWTRGAAATRHPERGL